MINAQNTSLLLGGLNATDSQLMAYFLGVHLVSPPITYLGLPLTSAKLNIRDCFPLVEKITKRIKSWKNKFLSYVGRLELVYSVLQTFHVYWARTFVLLIAVLDQVTVKLNSNGSVSDLRNGIWGVARDENGNVLLAYVGAGKEKSVLVQELKAILEGLRGCIILDKTKVLVAADSIAIGCPDSAE
ncbi:hypothetical protein FRX31_026238 [Thalictrum thalictroides]|uniref:RNase H type-1 domain-containing protein n=1 Tax=Thalictrum thalictroides TaxID=46969 RepID=A0A7J6VIY9_THATH|nr:hypothetical protein FRX31_026238 [Thalictrum thalictroides]